MGMTIDELKCIIGEYKLRIPPTVYYELLTDLEDAEFIPKADYENRLKSDMVAMLDELDLRLYEQYEDTDLIKVKYVRQAIQQKINSLKEDT